MEDYVEVAEGAPINDGITQIGNGIKTITLSKEENERLRSPWKNFLIIKLLGGKTTHQYLRENLVSLWKVLEAFPLIDLDLDFYISKFMQSKSVSQVLQNGSCFINGHYLSIKNWEPNFVPQNKKVTYSVVWVSLPHLPTKF